MATRTVVRKWGNSLGVVIPSEEVAREGLKENDEVEIIIRKTVNIKELFGRYKFKDLQKVKDELRPRITSADLAGSGSKQASVREMKRLLDRLRGEDDQQ